MRSRGREALWAYGSGDVFPVIVVPNEVVVSDAEAAETVALSKTARVLRWTVFILAASVLAVIALAFLSSRLVTRPIKRLARAAERLGDGDLTTQVAIHTHDELEELGDAFNRMGPQLAQGERMRRSLAVAMEIQQHLLPKQPPSVPGFEIAGKAVYCEETGGDYYDFLEPASVGPNMVGIAIGDVSGHGIGAALLMASARAVLRSLADHEGTDLGNILRALNLHLVQDSSPGRFMTLFYALLDAERRSLTWASAGHDPAMLVHGDTNGIEELGGGGLPLGILAEEKYTQSGPHHLESGDVIVFGTDGIWEAQNAAGTMFGKTRLHEILRECSGGSAQQIRETVAHAVYEFVGARPLADDVTMVVVKAL
jgi:sigma-B regulation protein RsbU (phosphoserine phosphatase)